MSNCLTFDINVVLMFDILMFDIRCLTFECRTSNCFDVQHSNAEGPNNTNFEVKLFDIF